MWSEFVKFRKTDLATFEPTPAVQKPGSSQNVGRDMREGGQELKLEIRNLPIRLIRNFLGCNRNVRLRCVHCLPMEFGWMGFDECQVDNR